MMMYIYDDIDKLITVTCYCIRVGKVTTKIGITTQ